MIKEGLDAPDTAGQNRAWQKFMKVVDDEALDCGFFDYAAYWAYNPKRLSNVVSTVGDVAVFRYIDAKIAP